MLTIYSCQCFCILINTLVSLLSQEKYNSLLPEVTTEVIALGRSSNQTWGFTGNRNTYKQRDTSKAELRAFLKRNYLFVFLCLCAVGNLISLKDSHKPHGPMAQMRYKVLHLKKRNKWNATMWIHVVPPPSSLQHTKTVTAAHNKSNGRADNAPTSELIIIIIIWSGTISDSRAMHAIAPFPKPFHFILCSARRWKIKTFSQAQHYIMISLLNVQLAVGSASTTCSV